MPATTAAGTPPPERHRLFFALVPPQPVRLEILAAADALRRKHPSRGGKWVAPERLHLTLFFLGDFAEGNDDMVARALGAGDRVQVPAFDIALDAAASFAGRRPPWVLRCEGSRANLLPLWHALDRELHANGFRDAPERDFTPHVTLLRDAERELPMTSIEPILWPVRDFSLVHSRTGREREYEVLGQWPLQAVA